MTAVVLLASGGLDSTVVAAMHPGALHLSVDYGQRHAVRELLAARNVARHYEAEQHRLRIPDLARHLPSALTGNSGALTGAPTVVPNRNAILIALAVGVAQAHGADTVLIGCNADDHADYPDCRPAFITATSEAARLATGVHVRAPLTYMSKPQIGALARQLDVPVHLTWSCYAGLASGPCGDCGACQQRERALACT